MTLLSLFLLPRLKSLFVLLVYLILMHSNLCFANDGINQWPAKTYSDKSLRSYLESDETINLFASALKKSKYWKMVVESRVTTLILPDNRSLEEEGSAFLLAVVLPKPENDARLHDVMAIHLSTEVLSLTLDRKEASQFSTIDGSCFNILASDGAVKVGPEARVTQIIKTQDATVYHVDSLLWVPYKDVYYCH